MEWLCAVLFFVLAGMLIWIFYLDWQLTQKNGWIESICRDVDWVKTNCPVEWAKIATTRMMDK